MPPPDLQHILAMSIVAVAAFSVGRRLWRQAQGFRSRPRRRSPAAAKKPTAPPVPSPLIQLQVKPPVHLKRPPADDR